MAWQKYDIEDAAKQWNLDVEKTRHGYIIKKNRKICFVVKDGYRYEIYRGRKRTKKPTYVEVYPYEVGLKCLSLSR